MAKRIASGFIISKKALLNCKSGKSNLRTRSFLAIKNPNYLIS